MSANHHTWALDTTQSESTSSSFRRQRIGKRSRLNLGLKIEFLCLAPNCTAAHTTHHSFISGRMSSRRQCRPIVCLFAALSLLSTCAIAVVVIGNDHPGDTQALHDVFAATGGAHWFNNANWTLPVSFCTWYGLSCTCSSTCRLSSIVMEINNLTGTLPSSLANLTALTKLDLYANVLGGPLPANAFLTLSNLTYMDLSMNRLSGTVPIEMANLTSISFLDLTGNQLSGTIPPQLGALPGPIRLFSLGNNQLNGTVPHELTNVPMEQFYVNNNKLAGTITPLVSRWGSLMKFFYIGYNQFVGPLPTFGCQNGTALVEVLMDYNLFNGTIPACYNSSLFPNLKKLTMAGNRITSNVPNSLYTLSVSLESLDLSQNLLTGTIDPLIGSLVNLKRLDFSSNAFEGTLPTSMTSMKALSLLNLAANSFTGSFELLSETFQPNTVNISSNVFSSVLPDFPGASTSMFALAGSTFGSAVNLYFFDVRNNQFVCPYPQYPPQTLVLRTSCIQTFDSFVTIIILVSSVLGFGIVVGGTSYMLNKYEVILISARTFRITRLIVTWLITVFVMSTDIVSLINVIYSTREPIDNCAAYNSYSVFSETFVPFSGLFYSELLFNYAIPNLKASNPTAVIDSSTFASSFQLVDKYSGFAPAYRQDSENQFKMGCEKLDSCSYVGSPSFKCTMSYPEKANFGDKPSRAFFYSACCVFALRMLVELTALGLVLHACITGKLWNQSVTLDFVLCNVYSVLLYVFLPSAKSTKAKPTQPAVSNSKDLSDSGVSTDDIGIDYSKSIENLDLSAFDDRINTRDAYLDAAISDSSHSEYLWRLVYDSAVKDIPLLLINFFYVTDIAVLGISPINAMSFIVGAIDVPTSLIHAYYAYLNQPVVITSHKTFAAPSSTAPQVEFDFDHHETRGKQIQAVTLPPVIELHSRASSPIASFQRRPSVLISSTTASAANDVDDSKSDLNSDIWSSVSVGGTVTHRMSKPIKPSDWINARPKLPT